MDAYSYRCCFFKAFSSVATVVSVMNGSKSLESLHEPALARAPRLDDVARFRASADVMVLPYVCCNNLRALSKCKRLLLPTDPPLVILLNKVFEYLDNKLSWIRSLGRPCTSQQRHAVATLHGAAYGPCSGNRSNGVALVVTAAPASVDFEASTGVRTRYLPYASSEAFGQFASSRRPVAYAYDLGFSGGYQMYARRYPLRATLLAPRKRRNGTVYTPSVRETLVSEGYRVGVWGWMATADYIRKLGTSKVWLATTESGDHVGTRFYEVMMSGRALLLCNRAPQAYEAIGLVEGVHAAMFNTSEEALRVLRYYLHHEDERLRIVANARRFVRSHHLWRHRATELVELIHDALDGAGSGSSSSSSSFAWS